MKTFTQFLAEKAVMFGTASSKVKKVNSHLKVVKPAKPFNGLAVTKIFAKSDSFNK